MAQVGGYREELENELKMTNPDSHASRLVAQEIERLEKGGEDEKKERPHIPLLDIHNERPQKLAVKIRVPVKDYPKYNFVGKLLGPKGSTLKELQQQTGCRMAIMGKGSMRDKDAEEERRKEGGKYAHLNEDLHVLVECLGEPTDGHHRIAGALAEIRKFLIPELQEEMYGGGDMGEMGMNGAQRGGRGGFRGPPERGGRGGFRGRGAAGPGGPPPGGRGAPAVRGAAPRGAPRGAAPRGAPARGAARGAAPPAAASTYDYGAQGYGSQAYNSQYDGTYDDYSRGTEAPYYDYNAPAPAADYSYSGAGYDGYSDGYAAPAKAAPPSSRGAARPAARAHPYSRPPQSGY